MLFAEERGRRILESLLARTRQLDATRPVTAACDRPDNSTVYDNLDVVGINYGLDSYDAVHKKFPDRAVVSTECCATSTTRGWYYDDFPAMGLTNCYDRDWSDWFRGRERTWKFIDEREWVMGSYQWIGFDHRGETVWPRLSSCSGAIDVDLFQKIVAGAVIDSRVEAWMMERLGAGIDHPLLMTHPEGEYLKGLHLLSRGTV